MSDIAELFHRLTLGVYVIGVADGERRDAFTAAWVMQVSFDPLLLALSINPGNASYPLLHAGGGFTVNVLKKGELELAKRLGTRSGRELDKLAGLEWRAGRNGARLRNTFPENLCRSHRRSFPLRRSALRQARRFRVR